MKRLCMYIAILVFMLAGCVQRKSQSTLQTNPYSAPVYSWDNVTGETITIWNKAHELERPYIQAAFARYENMTVLSRAACAILRTL